MGAANLNTHLPILQVLEKAGTTPFTGAQPEAAGQTFISGALVQLNNAGYVQQWDGATVAAGILGVSESFGQNLATAGAGAPVVDPGWPGCRRAARARDGGEEPFRAAGPPG